MSRAGGIWAAAEPLETFDSHAAASERLDFWAAKVTEMGMTRAWGVRVEFIRLSGRVATFGIYVRPRES